MEVSFIWMLWFSSLVLTIATFIWRGHVMFPMLAFIFWLSTAYSMVQIDYVGFGSQNPITYDTEMGDRYGEIALFYLLWFVAMIHLIVGVFDFFRQSKVDIDKAAKGKPEVWGQGSGGYKG